MNSENSPIVCIGHRGAMGYAPENTIASIDVALKLGCLWIEIDVYFVDGQLMIIHDDTLDRTTNGSGLVLEKSFDYLRSLDAGNGERIPTLAEVIERVNKRAGINVELKGPNTATPVANLLDSYIKAGWDKNLFYVSSFDHRELRNFKNLSPAISIGALLIGLPEDNAAFAERLGAYSANLWIEFVDKAFVEDAHKRGLKVFVFTVNTLAEYEPLKRLGINGIFSNYPDRFLHLPA